MQNLIFIKQNTYSDSLIAPQLNTILPHSVLLDAKWCCNTEPMLTSDIAFNMQMDNLVYMVNNYILSRLFENIIITTDFIDELYITKLLEHLNCLKYSIMLFDLTNTGIIEDVENFELKNKEYFSCYKTLMNGQLVRLSKVDVTGISAFKAAKTLESIIPH